MTYERRLMCIGFAMLSQLGLSTIGSAQGLKILEPGEEYVLNWVGSSWGEQGGSVTDFLVSPKVEDSYVLHVSVRGADGGWASNSWEPGDSRFLQARAGGGATVRLTIAVGDGDNEIPRGSELRVIVGSRGVNEIGSESSGGGGGGSALLVRRPSLHATWEVVAAAGGGGGGWRAKTAEVAGGSGSAENCDPDGPAGRWSLGAGGGGAFESSCQKRNPEDYQGTLCASGGIGGRTGYPVGGEGGKDIGNGWGSDTDNGSGGYGFGGGGQSITQGGGGGGYCGGDGGSANGHSAPSTGGGSWVEERYSVDGNITRIDGKETGSNRQGEVRLHLTRCFSIMSAHNGKYVAAETVMVAAPLKANRERVGPWEEFDIEDLGNGLVAIQSLHNGKYVAANMERTGVPLAANRDAVGPWEQFVIEHLEDGLVAIQSVHNGKYVAAELKTASARLKANRDVVGPWEQFVIEECHYGR